MIEKLNTVLLVLILAVLVIIAVKPQNGRFVLDTTPNGSGYALDTRTGMLCNPDPVSNDAHVADFSLM